MVVESDVSSWNFAERKPLDTTLNISKFQRAVDKQFTPINEVIKNFWAKCGGH